MFHNENSRKSSQRDRSKKRRHKKSDLHNNKSSTKYPKPSRPQRHHKHCKIKHINTVSDYVGPDRITKHVGIFTKGKISDSISRFEKIMPKEVRARAKQDLKEVLKLCSVKNTSQKKKNFNHNISSKRRSVQSSVCTPQYLYHKTGFASSLWKDKLQTSVGLPTVNSILDSVHQPIHKRSPVEKPQLIARNLILTKIHSLIKDTNNLLFPNFSNKSKLKGKLLEMKNKFACFENFSENISYSPSIPENSQISQTNEISYSSQNTVKEDFHLNPVFTGDAIHQNDITNIFPPVNDFICNSDLVNNIDFTNYSKVTNDPEVDFIQTSSSSIGQNSSLTIINNSPTSSEDSPAWKLQMSPVKFVPDFGSTPTLYFRHKMF